MSGMEMGDELLEVEIETKNNNETTSGEVVEEEVLMNELAVETGGMTEGDKSTGVGSTDSNDSGLAGDHSSPEHRRERAGHVAAASAGGAATAAAVNTGRQNRRRRPNASLKMPPYPGFGWANQSMNECHLYNGEKYSPMGAGAAMMDCEYGIDSNYDSHVVYVHVNVGETLNVRVGNEIQQIAGPATVRMVSRFAGPPGPLPLHVPPGHIVQQILDEFGTLKHLVLSPQTTSPNSIAGPFQFMNMTNGYMSPDGQYMEPYYDGMDGYTVSPVSCNIDVTNHEWHENAHSKDVSFQRPYKRSYYPNDRRNRGVPARVGGRRRRSGINREPFGQTNDRLHPSDARFPAKPVHLDDERIPRGPPAYEKPTVRESPAEVSSVLSESITVGTDEEERAKIRDMLSRIPPPRVSDVSDRATLVQWQPFDCSEASANGGSFPHIDSSEFSYEVILYKSELEQQRPVYSYRTEANLCPQKWLKNLKPATEYFVRLRASLEERDLVGDPSTSVTFKTKPAQPDKPDRPVLSGKTKMWLLVSWTKPQDNGSQLTSCHLEIRDSHSDGPNFKEVYSGLGDQFKILNLKPAIAYQIRLAASNSRGKSEYSDLLTASTSSGGAPPPPAPPSLVRSTPNSLSLQWTKRECDEEFELVIEGGVKGQQQTVMTRDVVYSLCDLSPFNQHRFWLRSVNEDGKSPLSDVAVFCTSPSPPSKPLVKGAVTDKAEIYWDIEDGIAGMKVLNFILEMLVEPSTSDWTTVYKGPEHKFTVSNLKPGSTCRLRVRCGTEDGKSEWSDELRLAVPAVPPGPCRPPTLTNEPTSSVLNLQWTAPDVSGGLEISEYELSMVKNGETGQCPPTPSASSKLETIVYRGPHTSAVSSNLHPGCVYSFKVRAFNAVGPGPWSGSFICETAPLPPECPQGLRVVEVKTRSVLLIWESPEMSNSGRIMEYCVYSCRKIERSSDSEGTPTTQSPKDVHSPTVSTSDDSNADQCIPDQTAALSFTFDGVTKMEALYTGPELCFEAKSLKPATEFAFCVQAVNSAGKSTISEPVYCRTLADVPDIPVILNTDPISTSQIMVTWDPPSDNGSPLLHYHLELTASSDRVQGLVTSLTLQHDCREYTVGELLPATSYRFRMKAINDIGSGEWSDPVESSTRSLPPPPPVMELASAMHNALKLKWRFEEQVAQDDLKYTLEMASANGSFVLLANDLTTRSYKVTRLTESTSYQFRVQAYSISGGVGEWSEVFTCSTSRAPPPAVKSAPRISNATETSCDVDWEPAKLTPSSMNGGEELLYCLQVRQVSHMSNSSMSEATFETAYKGTATSHHLGGLISGSAYKIRVFSVRVSDGGIETESASSPVASFTTISQASLRASEGQNRSKRLCLQSLRDGIGFLFGGEEQQCSDRQWAVLILVAFSVVALFVAFLLQRFIPEASPGENSE